MKFDKEFQFKMATSENPEQLFPWTSQIYSYIWDNFLWTRTNELSNICTLDEQEETHIEAGRRG